MKHAKSISLTTLAALAATTVGGLSATPVQASEKGRRNTTIALGAVTAYGLLKKKKTVAIAGGVGTALAYTQYNKSKRARQKREERRRISWYQQRYGRNWRTHYKRGS